MRRSTVSIRARARRTTARRRPYRRRWPATMRPSALRPGSASPRRGVTFLATLLCAGSAVAAPEDRGPYAVDRWDAGTLTLLDTKVPMVVYIPSDAPGARP